MKNTFGNNLSVTILGESHGECIGAVLDGLAPGIRIDREFISGRLTLRRPAGRLSTARKEADRFRIVSGVFNDRTTGTPLCILIPNSDTHSSDYEKMKDLMRPSHADYAAHCKYHGFQDYRGGGHFSGRLTAALTAAGAVAASALMNRDIHIGTHISRCAGISDRAFGDIPADISTLSDMQFAVLDPEKGSEMKTAIEQAAVEGDSVGGILETAVHGLPAGLGEPWFDSFESILSHILFSVPAVKGVQFGSGFALADMRGSQANDPFRMDGDSIVTSSNHNGGINGGITNGMPVIFSCVIKPTPSIFREQQTVDISKKENTTLTIRGRHDPAVIHRARVVVDSVTALAVYDMIAGRYGTDCFTGE